MLGSVEVYFYEKGLANIISLAKLRTKYRITFDSTNGNAFIVHNVNGKQMRFNQSPEGLYYHDTATSGIFLSFSQFVEEPHSNEVTLIDTVAENEEGFTKHQVNRAKIARDAYKLLGFPSLRDFKSMVCDNLIKICPISEQDVTNALKIYGPDIASLKGKTVRRAAPVVRTDYIFVPRSIFDANKHITLAGDIMYVNGIKFLVTVSRGINLVTSEYIPDRTKGNLKQALVRAIRIYQNKGMHVTTALADGEFEPLKGELGSTDLNAAAAAEHVSEVERKLRLIKERFRALRSTLPYKLLPGRIIVEGINFCVKWLNAFPTKTGVSKVFSPRTIMTGTTLDYDKHCKIPFGTYCQVFQDNHPSNTDKERTVPAICLGPTGNLQGSYLYFSLETRKKITRPQATPLPITDSIIQWVEKIARQQNMPENIIFTTNRGEIVEVDDDYIPDGLEIDESQYFPTEFPQECIDASEPTDDEIGIVPPLADPAYNFTGPNDGAQPHMIMDEDSYEHEFADDESSRLIGYHEHLAAAQEQAAAEAAENGPIIEIGHDPIEMSSLSDDSYSTATSAPHDETPPRYPTRHRARPEYYGMITTTGGRRLLTRGYHKAFCSIMYDEARRTAGVTANINENVMLTSEATAFIANEFTYATMLDAGSTLHTDDETIRGALPMVAHKVMLHMAMKKGLREFGARGETAVSTELMQIHMQNTFKPEYFNDLTQQQRRKALESLLFLNEKRTGEIKGRMCANGSTQREDFAKGEAASPTVATDAVIITSAIDAHEERDVAVIDLPGAFLHAEMDDVVHMVMRGRLAELMAETAPEIYRKYITYGKNGEAILYVTLQKALYGCLKSALLFYKKLVSEITGLGFELNPYDPCVANCMINGKQMTLTWHVDDLKISHVDKMEVTRIIEWFKGIYGNVRVSRGKVHDYLGMHLDFRDKGKLKISMVPFLKKIIDDFPEAITGSAATPAAAHLFDVRDDLERKPIAEPQAQAFHHATAQLLFATIRYRRDIATAVAFLCTRVRDPDEDDWGKLKRVLKYIRGTLYLPLTLEIDDMRLISWWVDASFAVHPDCKGHSGAMMSMGRGAIMAMSKKQKINTKSSTESEIVGVDDASTNIIWGNYFINAQGYHIEETEVFQDNISSSYLLVNGRESSGKRTKHMNVRYFFAKNRIENGEMKIKWCPTKKMLADPFTKPVQGSEFRVFRSQIMNVDESIPDFEMSWDRGEHFAHSMAKHTDHRPQECVGRDTILANVPPGTTASAA